MISIPFPIKLSKIVGVGNIDLNLQAGHSAYVFVGENGIGKTKLLEALYTSLLFASTSKFQGALPVNRPELCLASASLGQSDIDLRPAGRN
jgi:predicted ATPase